MTAPQLYIELTDTHILFYLLKKGRTHFEIKQKKCFSLDRHHIQNGTLFNLTHILQVTKKILHAFDLKKPRSILSIPALHKKNKREIHPTILQLLLCFCKSGVRIDRILSDSLAEKEDTMKIEKATLQQEIESRLNFFNLAFPTSKKELAIWIVASCLGLVALFSVALLLSHNAVDQLAVLNKRHNILLEENEDLKDKVHAFDHFQDSQKELLNRLKHLKSLQKQPNNMRRLLKTVSVSVQKTTWVKRVALVRPPVEAGTMIALENDEQLTQQPETFNIEGATLDGQEVVAFTKYLTHVQFVSKISIDSISREQEHPQHVRFALSGTVNTCSCPCALPFKQELKKDPNYA